MILPDNYDFLSLIRIQRTDFVEASFKLTTITECNQVIYESENFSKVLRPFNMNFVFALKQILISSHNTLNNLLLVISVYTVKKLKDEIKAAVVNLFILSIPFMTKYLFKIIQQVLIPEKYHD